MILTHGLGQSDKVYPDRFYACKMKKEHSSMDTQRLTRLVAAKHDKIRETKKVSESFLAGANSAVTSLSPDCVGP